MLQTVPDALLKPAAFLGFWVAISGILALVSGWRSLSADFRAPEDFSLEPADRFRMRSVQLRTIPLLPANYNSCMTIGITARGLYVRPWLVLRLFHPPLLIPWAVVEALTDGRFLWSRWTEVTVRGVDTRIRLSGSIGDVVRSEWRALRSGTPAA